MRILVLWLGVLGSLAFVVWVIIASTVSSIGNAAGSALTLGKVDDAMSRDATMGFVVRNTDLLVIIGVISAAAFVGLLMFWRR